MDILKQVKDNTEIKRQKSFYKKIILRIQKD